MNDQTISTFAKWNVKEGALENVFSLLKEAVAKSSAEKGNQKYQVFQDFDNTNTLMLFEEYSDREALEFHRNSKHFQEIIVQKILPLLESRKVIITSQIKI